MDELYLEVASELTDGCVQAPLETLVTLFTLKYCENPPVRLVLVLKPSSSPCFTVKIPGFDFEFVQESQLNPPANTCQLPVILLSEHDTVVAGLCGVLRQVVKSTVAVYPNHHSRHLLGFRQGCLMACAEASVWTRFCEVDMVTTVKEVASQKLPVSHVVTLPENVARFEMHMEQPLRVHNIHKKRQDLEKSKNMHMSKENCFENVLEHTFAEGPSMTLADVILFPCMFIIITFFRSVYLHQNLPLTSQWFDKVLSDENIASSISIVKNLNSKVEGKLYVDYILPEVPRQSLYKSDPRRYKPRARVFTRQEEVESSLKAAAGLCEAADWCVRPLGWDLEFDWAAMPPETRPEGGQLPALRCERKGQQLENLTKAVLKVARPGHIIVDFCSGSGHLGIVLAHLLPRCQIVLLENKEESLGRARERVTRLCLGNVSFCQSNLDYFLGDFDIGVSLHACGVATDLVIQRCITKQAVFVCCPCCYGSVQNNHVVTYPRSQLFRDSALTLREYLVLGHSADQTHDKAHAKTNQGKACMGLIDTDRCLQAQESGYTVTLSKLVPESCTPKNNLLVGLPKHWNNISDWVS